jgi:superfamily II DNA or RNA helicase
MAHPFELRDYQIAAVEQAETIVRGGTKHWIFQAPTGSGKTLVAAHIMERARRKNRRCLMLGHRGELARQPYEKLIESGVAAEHIGVMWAGEKKLANPGAPIQCGTIQSVAAFDDLPPADIVIVDEAHRGVSPTYVKLLARYPNAVVIGLTATPERLDGRPLREIFEKIIVVAQPSQLVARGFILAPRVFTVPQKNLPDLRDVPRRHGDFEPRALAAAVRRRHLVGSIVEHWLARAERRRTISFATDRVHSQAIVMEFCAAGVRALHVDATTPKAQRKRALEQLRSGEIEVVSQCDLWIEGIDAPEVKCAILARPTESITIHLQSIGRIVRPWESITAVVLDHAGNARRLGLSDFDRTFSLDGRRKRVAGEDDDFGTRTCPSCYLVMRAHVRVCPQCGEVFRPEPDRSVRTVAGTLVELTREAMNERLTAWQSLWRRAYREGYRPAWVRHAYRTRFSEDVPRYFEQPPRPPATDEDKKKFLTRLSARAHHEEHDDGWVVERYRNRFGENPPGWTPGRRTA